MLEETKAVKEIAQANALAIYQDAAQPSVRVLGKSLAQCASLFATPMGRAAEIFEKNIHRYLDKLDGLKEEEITPPDARILVPILEKMRFIEEEKVAEYYSQILATASTREHSKKVMITFIEILNRLTADEIKILEYVSSDENKIPTPKFTDEELVKYGLTEKIRNTKEIPLAGGIPVVDIKIVKEGNQGYSLLKKNFCALEEKISLNEPNNLGSYFDNMTSLGLLERRFDVSYAIQNIYKHLEEHQEVALIKLDLEEKQKVEFDRGKIELTDLGRKLLELCSSNKK